MSGRIEGKVAVVTGGASGMGRGTALRFPAEGARVVIADLNEETAAATLAAAREAGAAERVRFARTDVAVEGDVERMFSTAVAEFGRVDCVFNNAGVGGAFGPITEIDAEDWDKTFAVLVRGVFLGIKHGARAMLAAGGGGAIINTSSVAGLSGGAGPAAYSAAKAAVINLTRAAALELAPQRIRVNAIGPGGILTPLLHRGAADAVAEVLDRFQPWPEHGRGSDIANAALFLASDEARFITGEALVVDGGLEAAGPNVTKAIEGAGDGLLGGVVGFDEGTTGRTPTLRRRS